MRMDNSTQERLAKELTRSTIPAKELQEEKPARLFSPAPSYVSNIDSMNPDYVDNTLSTMGQPKGYREEKRESSTRQPRFFQPVDDKKKKATILTLLTHVVQGEEAEAKAMIKKEPTLLLNRGQVEDYSGRTIEGTAFQLALGAEDVEMLEMMVPYLDEDEKHRQYEAQFPPEKEKAEQQCQKRDLAALQTVFKAIGASNNDKDAEKALVEFRNYLKPGGVIKTGKHFNAQLLLKAFELYDQHYEAFGNTWKSRKNQTAWRKVVGYIQRFLPACYAQAFCQGIYYIVKNREKLHRSLEFRYDKGILFYPLDSDSSSRLGFDHACHGRTRVRPGGFGRPFGCLGVFFRKLCQAKAEELRMFVRQKKKRLSFIP